MSDPARVARWWGPSGFTNTIHEYDFRSGGKWLLTMHGPDGKDYPNESRFTRIVANQLFEIEHFSGHHFLLTIELLPLNGGTDVKWLQTFDTAEHYQQIASFVASANEQNLDRLAAEVQRGESAWPSRHTRGVSMHIDGTCHCGSISFSGDIDPAGVTVCHCADCQILSGAPFRTVVEVPIDTFTLSGQPKLYATVQHGKPWIQAFCPTCGTPLFAGAAESPTSVIVRLGCVTQRAELRPYGQIWRNLAMPWLPDLQSIPDADRVSAPARAGDHG
jgi:uncharacterized protein YndB with AHSA1/START domain